MIWRNPAETLFAEIFRGEDCTVRLAPGIIQDAMIEFEITEDTVGCVGTGEGAYNGFAPLIKTNLLCMQQEKDYYLYLDDMFGENDAGASSELFIDLKKVTVR